MDTRCWSKFPTFVSGTVCGHLVAWAGRKAAAYEDDELAGAAEHSDEDSMAVAAQAEVTLSAR